jgi:MFS family permease
VWLLGWVSLATDAASEAIYPLLPFFLTRVLGAGAVSLGVIEGAAEAVNSILKIVSGRMADRARSKRPLVLFGYSVSSIARPFIAVTTTWTQVLIVRVLDRMGKGIRSAPRDAMLATWTTSSTRGKVYGFHRGMDHFGAVIGPAVASLFLVFYPDHYRTLFALTIIPGAIAVTLILFVREPEDRLRDATASPVASASAVASGFSRTVPGALPREFTAFMLVLALFTLGNSTDAFLLLKLTDVAGSVRWIPLMWSALHVVKAIVSMVGGSWSDRIGRRAVIAIGWIVYAAVYAGFATSRTLTALVVWFLIYGLYFGFTEGTEKALVGISTAVQGLGALAASVLFGAIWTAFGSAAAFGLGAGLALAATTLLFVVVRPAPSV